MTRNATSDHFDDPAQRWNNLLDGLYGRRRDAVVEALRASVQQGYPASSEGVRLLVSYALGQISARQYAARMLDVLGFREPPPEPSRTASHFEPLPDLATWRTGERRPSSWQEPRRRPSASTSAPWSPVTSRKLSREETVQAYVSGRIPVEEFLRLSRVRTS